MEETKTKGYKFWHLLVVFVLGAAVVAAVFLVPSYLGKGFSKIELPLSGSDCDVTTCDLQEQLDELLRLFRHYTGALDSFTSFSSSFTRFTEEAKESFGGIEEALEKIGSKLNLDLSKIFK